MDAIEKLASADDAYAPVTASDARLFDAAMAACDAWHRARNPRYARLWTDGARPVVPVGVFKREDLATAVYGAGAWLSTSGTSSGARTRVFFDEASMRRIERAMMQVFRRNGLVERKPARFLLLSPDPSRAAHAGYATAFLKFTACAPAAEVVFAVDDAGVLRPEVAWGALRRWAPEPVPIFVFGLTVHLEGLALSGDAPLQLSAPIRGLTGGGWKGVTQRLSRPEIVARLRALLRAPSVDIRDVFGLTEHALHYVSCAEGRFHVPKYSRFEIVDAAGRAAAPGERGLIRLLNPFFASLPSHDLLTEDEGTWGAGCACGETLPYLQFLGRVSSAAGTCAMSASGRS
jgi:hypothetical protein